MQNIFAENVHINCGTNSYLLAKYVMKHKPYLNKTEGNHWVSGVKCIQYYSGRTVKKGLGILLWTTQINNESTVLVLKLKYKNKINVRGKKSH